MEITTSRMIQERDFINSNNNNNNGVRNPTSCNNNISSSSSSSVVVQIPTTPQPLTPKTRSDNPTTTNNINNNNPYPTTFVQADTSSFKQVVQMLTGSSETAKHATDPNSNTNTNTNKGYIPPIKKSSNKPGFKLYERRNSLKNGLKISPLIPGLNQGSNLSPRTEILSPSILNFPSLALSPVTPLGYEDSFNKPASSPLTEEDKAIAEKKFYLHPSPRNSEPPQLLPLFPVTSPRVSSSSSSSSPV